MSAPAALAPGTTAWTTNDLLAWPALTPLGGEYLPWSSASLRPAALVAVLNDVIINERRAVVECGAGVSTVFLARLLKRLGAGQLVSLEHDLRWARVVSRALDRESLGLRAAVVHAPLSDHAAGWDAPWYEETTVRAALPEAPIDLLLVDGPPAWTLGSVHSRYPALPLLLESLAPDATIVLDDAGRAGEQEVLERWEAETGLRFERRADQGGIAITRRGAEPPLGA